VNIAFHNHRPRDRRGAVLAAVLVLAVLAAMLLAVWLKAAVAQHRQLRLRAYDLQAAWLVEAGLERAAARLAADPAYEGESWTVAAEQLQTRHAGQVEIRVASVADQPALRQVSVSADYPRDATRRARRGKQIEMALTVAAASSRR
jgi:type II secretory pathway component PulK